MTMNLTTPADSRVERVEDSASVSLPEYRVALKEVGTRQYPVQAVGDSVDAATVVHDLLHDADREHLVAVYLNGRNTPVGVEILAMGRANGTSTTAVEVFKGAIIASATAVVLGHNHPSGHPSPSRADRAFTQSVVTVGALLGLPVLDHVIVTRSGRTYSFRNDDPDFGETESE